LRARLLRRFRSQSGYSLIELIVVLTIFLTILTALTSLFVSGAKTELDANKRFQAQQHARLALDKLRRELHCSNGITALDGSALPAPPATSSAIGAGGTPVYVNYEMVAAGAQRYELRRTVGSTTTPIADYLTSANAFQYTAQSTANRAILHVELPVNINPNEGWNDWALADDIVLRNTLRAP
jgi:prepilin-type N-terminal cleavage/methylation domain-containing protein